MIYGNSGSQATLQEFLTSNRRTITLTGPAHLGKASYAKELLESSVHPSDLLLMEPGVDGVREMISFCKSTPLDGRFRAVLIDDANLLGEPAQDALLKITEEPHDFLKVILVAHDIGHLQPALRSRIRESIAWAPLSRSELTLFAESLSSVVCEPLLALASGIPGFYKVMMETAGFEDFYESACKIASGTSKPFLSPVPTMVKELKGPSPVRDTIVHVLRLASRKASDTSRALSMLEFCGTLTHTPSASAELHWMRMSANLSDVI